MNKENVELTKRLRDFFQIYLPKQNVTVRTRLHPINMLSIYFLIS